MLRVIVSPTRSGSTALLRCFENNPAVDRVFHQPVKSGFRQDGRFDYSFYELDADRPDRIYVAKETIGGFEQPETSFAPLPEADDTFSLGRWQLSRELIQRIEPLVLVRDPVQTWDSIHALNEYSAGISPYFSPFEYFVTSYKNVFSFFVDARARSLPVRVVTLELLGSAPDATLQKICKAWGIPWADSMVKWLIPYGVRTWFSDEAQRRMEHDPRFRRSKEAMANSWKFGYRPRSLAQLDAAYQAIIVSELMPLYEDLAAEAQETFA